MQILAWVVFFVSLPVFASEADLRARWLGVAGLEISDGETTLLFDPVFTKPSLRHWIFGSEFRPDAERVKRRLADLDIRKSDAIFVSHTHFDHAVDAPLIARETGAVIHGGPSLRRVTNFLEPQARFSPMEDRELVQVGKFRIRGLQRKHAPILQGIGWEFLPGDVPSDFSARFFQYAAGETWSYVIEHPQGRILVDQGSHSFPGHAEFRGKIDVYFVGVSNRKSFDDLVRENIEAIGAKRVFPLHFDFFFLQSEWLERLRLPGLDLEGLRAHFLDSKSENEIFSIPRIGEPFSLKSPVEH